MWTQDSALLLLIACCFWSAEAQRQSVWDDPVKFKTQAKDSCTMIVTGQGDYTRLRLSCQGSKRSYWCEYMGMPYTCRNYNKNPRHYFVQMMWRLRKLQNACQAPRQIKPHMCRNAADESQMVYVSGSFSRPDSTRPAPQPARPQPRPSPTRQTNRDPPREKTTPRPSPQPTTPPEETKAKTMARQHCWRSLRGLCSFFIGLFHRN
ncbi:fibroblast growth factor binding protein 2a [Sebastes fasciatus]|uniref:fibroblast growth factor binding protein 2a n=1 Tax=Sebastes fasciatus TaxID=394691 RepID=UPI003D9F0D77